MPVLKPAAAVSGGLTGLLLRRIASLGGRVRSLRPPDDEAGRQLTARQVLDHPLSPFTEAIRSLRMGLRYANLDNPSKVILVTSALPG